MIIFVKRDGLNGITNNSTIADLLQKLVNINYKNSVIWQESLDELIKSKTLICDGELSTNIQELLLEDVKVNEEILKEILSKKFYKFAKQNNKKVVKYSIFKFNDHLKTVPEIEKFLFNSKQISTEENYEDLIGEEMLSDLLHKSISEDHEFSLVEQQIETVDNVEAEVELKFKIENNEILPASSDKVTKNIMPELDDKELIEVVRQFEEVGGIFKSYDEEGEYQFSFKKEVIESMIDQSIELPENYFIHNTSSKIEIFTPIEKQVNFKVLETNMPVDVYAFKTLNDDETLEVLMKDNLFLKVQNIPNNLSKDIFYEILEMEDKSSEIIQWIFDSKIIDQISLEEIVEIEEEFIFSLLTREQIVKLVKSDKNKKLKKALPQIYESIDELTLFNYFKDVKEADASGLLSNSKSFSMFVKLIDKINNFKIDELTIQRDEIIKMDEEIRRYEKLSLPFKDERVKKIYSNIKSIKEKLFLPSIDEINASIIDVRSKLEEAVGKSLNLSSIAVGQFNKMVDKISTLSKKRKSVHMKNYKKLGELAHWRESSKADKPKEILKISKQLDSIRKDIERDFTF